MNRRSAPKARLTAYPTADSAAPAPRHEVREFAPEYLAPYVVYRPSKGVDEFVREVADATSLQLVETERHGVQGRFLKDVSKRLDIPAGRVFDMLGVPKATAEKKASAGEAISGSGGQAALGMVRLIAQAQELVAQSTAPEAKNFDAVRWLGGWLELPQPSLGGRRPADLMDTPTGFEVVSRLLGSLQSGAYQ